MLISLLLYFFNFFLYCVWSVCVVILGREDAEIIYSKSRCECYYKYNSNAMNLTCIYIEFGLIWYHRHAYNTDFVLNTGHLRTVLLHILIITMKRVYYDTVVEDASTWWFIAIEMHEHRISTLFNIVWTH